MECLGDSLIAAGSPIWMVYEFFLFGRHLSKDDLARSGFPGSIDFALPDAGELWVWVRNGQIAHKKE